MSDAAAKIQAWLDNQGADGHLSWAQLVGHCRTLLSERAEMRAAIERLIAPFYLVTDATLAEYPDTPQPPAVLMARRALAGGNIEIHDCSGCDDGASCHWPNCRRTGPGLGHHP